MTWLEVRTWSSCKNLGSYILFFSKIMSILVLGNKGRGSAPMKARVFERAVWEAYL